jgi:hypothetical protein
MEMSTAAGEIFFALAWKPFAQQNPTRRNW